jgi:hypothetical protein
MVRTISADALDIIGAGGNYSTILTVTVPGDEPIEVEHEPSWAVAEKGALSGTRLSVSSLQLLPSDGIDDLFAFAGWPGAVYNLSVGINLGWATEEIPVFRGRAVEGSSVRNELGVSVSLQDDWQWFDGVPFTKAYPTAIVTRASQIQDIIQAVMPGLTFRVLADGSSVCVSGVYTNTRGEAVAQLAEDGLLAVGFNALGEFIIKARRDLDTILTSDWHFRTDQDSGLNVPAPPTIPATIITGSLERTRPWAESLVNSVRVNPGAEFQLWKSQTARLTDESDPRHEDYIGLREIVITSKTIGTAWFAWQLAQAELTRRLRVTAERVKLSVALNPAVEADDVIFVSALPTLDDTGWNGNYIATSVTHAPSEGKTNIEAVSAAAYSMGT